VILFMTYSAQDHTYVVCAYGESPYLRECLRSLRAQTVPSNVIVSTSTPNAMICEAADEFSAPLFASNEVPSISGDWNRALSHVETSLATIAHQDDVYLPRYTERMLGYVNRADRPLIFFSNYGEIRGRENSDESPILKVKRLLLHSLINQRNWSRIRARRRALSLGCSICCPSVTFNLNLLERPLFEDVYRCDLDWQTWERLSKMDGSFVYSPELLMRHRIHEDSETTALIKDDTRTREDLEMLSKFWPVPIARLVNRFYSISQNSND